MTYTKTLKSEWFPNENNVASEKKSSHRKEFCQIIQFSTGKISHSKTVQLKPEYYPPAELTQSCFSSQGNNKIRCLSSCRHFNSTFFLLPKCPAGHCPQCNADFSLPKLCVMHHENLQKQLQVNSILQGFISVSVHPKKILPQTQRIPEHLSCEKGKLATV